MAHRLLEGLWAAHLHSLCNNKERSMDAIDEWTDRLLEAEDKIAEAYELLAALQAELKDAGRKKDAQAIGETVERLARYGRLFQDIRQSWAEPED